MVGSISVSIPSYGYIVFGANHDSFALLPPLFSAPSQMDLCGQADGAGDRLAL